MTFLHRLPWRAARRLAVSGLVVALVFELLLRTAGAVLPGTYRTGPMVQPDAELGWRNIPGSTTWFRRPEYTVRADINAEGRLGPVVPVARSSTPRVLLLGDSFLATGQVRYEASFGALLPSAIGRPLEVVNDGVSGFGTDQELLIGRRDVPRFAPDAVVLLVTVSNDVWNNDWLLEGSQAGVPKPYFELVGDDLVLHPLAPQTGQRDASAFLAQSALLSALKSAILDPLSGRGLRAAQLDVLREPSGEWIRAWRITTLLLDRLGSLQRDSRTPIVVGIIPDVCQVYADSCKDDPSIAASTVPQRLIAAAATAAGLRVVDLLPEFRRAAAAGSPRLYYLSDLHWAEPGHALAVRLMAPEVAKLLPPPSGAASPPP